VEELDRKIGWEEINLFLRKNKNGQAVGKDGCPTLFENKQLRMMRWVNDNRSNEKDL
jgi:hypothetical protein